MVEVTCQNFEKVLADVQRDIKAASFTCFDFEFTGLHTNRCPPISLFDTPQERYTILKESCKDFTVLQCGLSLFQYDKTSRVYNCRTYNFYLFPRVFKDLNRQVYFDTSACEFLMKYDFDLNKCFYGGISHLNEQEIEDIEEGISKNSDNAGDIVLNNVKSDFKDRKLASIKKWSVDSSYGEKDFIDCFSQGMLTILKHEIMDNFDEVVSETVPNETSLLEIKKVTKEEKRKLHILREHLEKKLLNEAIGFTHVFRLLKEYKKPIVGHNVLMDFLFLYEKFFRPLPDSYEEFKFTVCNDFPYIFDTRHIISNLKVELRKDQRYDKFFRSTTLLSLFEECNSKSVKGLLYQPVINDNFTEESGMREHDAGHDSCLVGHVFIRLAHFYTLWRYNSPSVKPFHFQDYMRELTKFNHCLNLIRCSLTHIDLSQHDPESIRPQWLIVSTRDKSYIVPDHVAKVLSAFGNLDVRKTSKSSCLVAMPSVGMAAGLLVVMGDHKKYNVKRYKASSYMGPLLVGLVVIPITAVGVLFLVRNKFM